MVVPSAVLGDSQVKPSCESSWLLLGPDMGLLYKWYSGLGLSETSCCLFERIYEVVKHEQRPASHMEKQLGRVHKFSGTDYVGIFRMSQIVLARLMESHIWH